MYYLYLDKCLDYLLLVDDMNVTEGYDKPTQTHILNI